MQPSDPFDPRTWVEPVHQFRLYAGANADIACLVDEEDYLYFSRWLWKPAVRKKKVYLARTGPDRCMMYLHREVLLRAVGAPPTNRRVIADHLNGDSLDNRRQNLRWATKRENNRNRFGSAWQRQMGG